MKDGNVKIEHDGPFTASLRTSLGDRGLYQVGE
jgi:hypothetical protein